MKSVEGATAQLNMFVNVMNESKVLQIGEALEKMFPVVAWLNLAMFSNKHVTKLRSLDGRYDEKVLAVLADALKGGNHVVSMDTIDLRVDHDAFEHLRIGDRLLSLPVRRESVDDMSGKRHIDMTAVLDFGRCKDKIQLRLVGQRRAANHGKPTRELGLRT